METINLQSVKIALNRDEMEEMVGGSATGGGGKKSSSLQCWSGFGFLLVVGVVAGAAVVSSGGVAAVFMATGAGQFAAAGITASGVALLNGC